MTYATENQMNTEQLTAIFEKVGDRYGYEEVSAKFTPFKDFKLRWSRGCSWIRFEVSDYFADAPEDVLEDFADYTFAKIKGEDREHSPKVIDHLMSESFILGHRQEFVERNGLRSDPRLTASLGRLTDRGLVKVENIMFKTTRKLRCRAFEPSRVFKVVMVNSDMVDDATEDELDCAIYHALCYLEAHPYGTCSKDAEDRMAEALDRMEDVWKLTETLQRKGYKFF